MIASMETYLRRGRRTCQRLLLNPKIRTGGVVLLCGGSGFLLSAASLGNYPQPLAMGLILAMSGWHAAVMSLGAMLGYWVFWGIAGLQGLVWSASGGLLALLLARHIPEEQPLIFPAISAFLTALTGLLFQLVLRDTVPVPVYFLRIVLAAGAGLLFPVALRRRTAVTDWLVGGVAVLALAQASPTPYLGLGYLAAGALAVGSAFPAAVLGGLGLDLAQVTNIPMTAVLCLAGVIRMIPFERKWMRCLAPGAACMVVMAICGIRDYTPLPGLILGGGLGNMIDRVARGFVVDMFEFDFISFPIFNFADVLICVGTGLLFIFILFFYEKYFPSKKKRTENKAAEKETVANDADRA